MKDIKSFIAEAAGASKVYGSFEDWIKSLKLKYTKEVRKSNDSPCPFDDCGATWEEYILDDFDTITSLVYCKETNEFGLCIDSLFVDMEELYADEDPVAYMFPADVKLFTKANIKKAVKNYENGE